MEVESLWLICVLIKTLKSKRASSLWALPHEDTRRWPSANQEASKPSHYTRSTRTLISEFYDSRPWEIEICCLNHSVYGILNIAIWPETSIGNRRNVSFGSLSYFWFSLMPGNLNKQLFNDKEQFLLVNMNTHQMNCRDITIKLDSSKR